jgi:putative endonuclease
VVCLYLTVFRWNIVHWDNQTSIGELRHNKGKGAKYTKTRLPVVLMVSFESTDRSNASKEEYRIKQLKE